MKEKSFITLTSDVKVIKLLSLSMTLPANKLEPFQWHHDTQYNNIEHYDTQNIRIFRIGWKSLPRTNTLAWYENP